MNTPKIIYSIKDVEDYCTYFIVQVDEEGCTYAYYMQSNHLRTVLNDKEQWKNFNFISKEVLDEECNLSLESAPFVHIVKVF